jgi:hypothetical protein
MCLPYDLVHARWSPLAILDSSVNAEGKREAMQPIQPADDASRSHMIHRADALEKSLDQTEQSMVRTEHLMALVEGIAKELYQLAEDWEPIDPQRAERWRAQEQHVRALSEEFAHLEELEAEEAKSIIATLRQMAHQARH